MPRGDLESQITLKVTLLLLLPPTLYAEQRAKWSGMSLEVTCPGCVLSHLLVSPILSPLADEVGGRKGLGNAQFLLSSNENIPELPTLFPVQIQNTASYQPL